MALFSDPSSVTDPLGTGLQSGPLRPANGYRPVPKRQVPSVKVYGDTKPTYGNGNWNFRDPLGKVAATPQQILQQIAGSTKLGVLNPNGTPTKLGAHPPVVTKKTKPKGGNSGGGDTSGGGSTTSTTGLSTDPNTYSDPKILKALLGLAGSSPDFSKLATAMAEAITGQGVGAYRSLQHQDIHDANNQALAILAASRAGASLISNLTGSIPQENTNIANDLAGVASGYTGQLGTDATKLADSIAAKVAANGGPVTHTTPNGFNINAAGPSGQNALYASEGALPAGNFLSQALQANRERGALPAEFIGSGQQNAMLQTAAGHREADKLLPQIVGLLNKEPSLATQLLSSLSSSSAASRKAQVASLLAAYTIEKDAHKQGIDAFRANTAQDRADTAATTATNLETYRTGLLNAANVRNEISRFKALHPTSGKLSQSDIINLAKNIALGQATKVTQNGIAGFVRVPGHAPVAKLENAVAALMGQTGLDAATAQSILLSIPHTSYLKQYRAENDPSVAAGKKIARLYGS